MSRTPKCRTKFCQKLARPGKSPYCPKHNMRLWRERHPVNYFFSKLKYRAKERGHEFKLTREQFAELWQQKGLNGGKTKFSLSFHRKENSKGYELGNVELLTLSENSRVQYVPYFSKTQDEQTAIAETSVQIKQLIEAGEL